jgi:hypothetical protein
VAGDEGGGRGRGRGCWRRRRRAALVWRGAHSRFAEIPADEPHSYDPSEHRNLKHEKAGTIVTFLATPYFPPPTVEATWVPCPSHPVPSAGRMPLTAWHEAHSACSKACEEGRVRGGVGGERVVSGGRLVWGVLGRGVWVLGAEYSWWGGGSGQWAGGAGCGRVHAKAATGAALSHRVPGNHATSEVTVRALHASVYNVHAHAHAR